jgi:uncharacterized integral membrane protein (TIGR00697 family)
MQVNTNARQETGKIAVAMVFAVALVLSNVVAAKVVAAPLRFFGGVLSFPGAVFCYALTFLATDIAGERWGRAFSALLVRLGFAVQILAAALLAFTGALPAMDPALQESYDRILGPNWIFASASLAAYAVSQSADVFIFHGLRDRILARRPGAFSRRWIWNNVSTMTAQAIDTAMFVGLAFGVGLGWLSDPGSRRALFSLALGQYLVKVVLAALDTPFFYLFTRRREDGC